MLNTKSILLYRGFSEFKPLIRIGLGHGAGLLTYFY